MRQLWMVGLGVAAALLTSGCGGGGGLFGGLFGGDGSESILSSFFAGGAPDGGSGTFQTFASVISSGSEDAGSGVGDLGGGLDGGLPGVATVHNPEPASVALFGVGLSGVAFLRRRRTSRRRS